jgi:hypothetical protein
MDFDTLAGQLLIDEYISDTRQAKADCYAYDPAREAEH